MRTLVEVNDDIVVTYINSLDLVKGSDELYLIEVKEGELPEGEFNFDVTSLDWVGINESDFITILENKRLSDIIIEDFINDEGRIKANITCTIPQFGPGIFGLELSMLNISDIKSLDIGPYTFLILDNNQLTEFNPRLPLPKDLNTIVLSNNLLTEFNPTLPLPSGLKDIYLNNNLLTEFNPILPLPNTLNYIRLSNNLLTEFNPTLPLPSGLTQIYLNNNQLTEFNPTLPLPFGTEQINLEGNLLTMLSSGWGLSTSIQLINIKNNKITDWTLSELWADSAPIKQVFLETSGNPTSVENTEFKRILESKFWFVTSL